MVGTEFPSQFCIIYTVKSPSITQRSVTQENSFRKRERENLQKKKIKNRLFVAKVYAQIILFLRLKTIAEFSDSEVWMQGDSTIRPIGTMCPTVNP